MKLLLQGRYATGSPPNLGNLPLVNFTPSFVLPWDCIPGPGQAQVEGGSHVAALRFIWAGVVCQPKRGGPTPRGRRCRHPERDRCRLCCPNKLGEAKPTVPSFLPPCQHWWSPLLQAPLLQFPAPVPDAAALPGAAV